MHLKLLSNPPGTSFARMPAPQTFLGWSGLAAASSLADVAHVSGGPAGVADTIELDPEVAMGLGWGEGAVLEIGTMHGVGKARSVSVTPVSADDWEVIVSRAGRPAVLIDRVLRHTRTHRKSTRVTSRRTSCPSYARP